MKVMRQIIEPTINGLARDGIPYKGFLFAGLMIDKHGNPKLLEYNIRMGDPETQAILTRLESDLVEILFKAADRRLHEVKEVKFSPDSALCVVMAAKGYPEVYEKGAAIELSAASLIPNTVIYHAGTSLKGGKVVSSGGRVLGVTGKGKTIQEAFDNAYKAVKAVKCDALFYRNDIGHRAFKKN
jgi:phosphoribosylamine--glycine ligase